MILAANGKGALQQIIKNKEFDLVFMDMEMPVMNGYQATEILRKQGIDIPIIALTANCWKETGKMPVGRLR